MIIQVTVFRSGCVVIKERLLQSAFYGCGCFSAGWEVSQMQATYAVNVDGVILTPEIIRAARKKIPLTLAKFAAKVGVYTETACRWESGRMRPSVKHGRKIIKVLGLTPQPASLCPVSIAQKDGQLTVQESVPPVQVLPPVAGQHVIGQPVGGGMANACPYVVVVSQGQVNVIAEKAEQYIAVRNIVCKP